MTSQLDKPLELCCTHRLWFLENSQGVQSVSSQRSPDPLKGLLPPQVDSFPLAPGYKLRNLEPGDLGSRERGLHEARELLKVVAQKAELLAGGTFWGSPGGSFHNLGPKGQE
jgi:hypothetical protein